MTDSTVKGSSDAAMDEPGVPEPTQAEIDAWAARERQRREAWLNGPSDAERAEYAQQLRSRRLAEAFDEGEHRIEEGVRTGLHYGREAQLAAEGAVNLFYRWSRRTMAELVRAGREWEEDTALPRMRRRVSMDDDGS